MHLVAEARQKAPAAQQIEERSLMLPSTQANSSSVPKALQVRYAITIIR